MWQEFIVGACVIAAMVFLARRYLPFLQKKSAGCDTGCGGCGGPTSCHTPTKKVV